MEGPEVKRAIPRTVVLLGTVLDLTTERERNGQLERTTWEPGDVGGLAMCTDARAMGKRAGTASLYLLRGQAEQLELAEGGGTLVRDAARTFNAWHEREPDSVHHLDALPDSLPCFVGHCTRIGYRSDKWGKPGEHHDYDHDYTEPGYRMPEVWADCADLAQARAVLVRGGNQRITPRGID
jgi:hypothetical protein